jgi:hypothetical protein
MSLSGIVSLYFVGLPLGYWAPIVAPEPSGESESRPEVESMFMPQFFWGSVVESMAWAFVQCHRKTWYWCHGAWPEWEWSKFHGGAQVALEPPTELESGRSHFCYFNSFEPLVEFVKVMCSVTMHCASSANLVRFGRWAGRPDASVAEWSRSMSLLLGESEWNLGNLGREDRARTFHKIPLRPPTWCRPFRRVTTE